MAVTVTVPRATAITIIAFVILVKLSTTTATTFATAKTTATTATATTAIFTNDISSAKQHLQAFIILGLSTPWVIMVVRVGVGD